MASINFCYGDSGRIPIVISSIAQCIKYFNRVNDLCLQDSDNLVRHAFEEQKKNNLEWFNTWSIIINRANQTSPIATPSNIQAGISDQFMIEWQASCKTHKKLEFYNSVNDTFGEKLYLQSNNFEVRKAIARMRSSAHDLNIERGRYKTIKFGYRIFDRLCRFCCTNDVLSSDNLLMLEQLPFYETNHILESESHIISTCPAYHHLRMNLGEELKSLIIRNDYKAIIAEPRLIDEFGIFLYRSYTIRNPKV